MTITGVTVLFSVSFDLSIFTVCVTVVRIVIVSVSLVRTGSHLLSLSGCLVISLSVLRVMIIPQTW